MIAMHALLTAVILRSCAASHSHNHVVMGEHTHDVMPLLLIVRREVKGTTVLHDLRSGAHLVEAAMRPDEAFVEGKRQHLHRPSRVQAS